jgi:hypothetical protein
VKVTVAGLLTRCQMPMSPRVVVMSIPKLETLKTCVYKCPPRPFRIHKARSRQRPKRVSASNQIPGVVPCVV